MPITDTLKNAEDFRRTGFTEEQSNLLANKLEEVVQANNEDLKGFIRQEFKSFEIRMDARFSELRAEFHESLKDLTIKILGVTIGVTIGAATVAVAVIKLFPNFY